MRLLKVQIEGVKRFTEPVVLWAEGKLTAVVGPNEAGKTTLLEAMAHLDSDVSFLSPEEGSPPASRSRMPEPAAIVVAALFRLEDHDRRLVKNLPGSETLRFLSVARRADGGLVIDVTPRLNRDLEPRKRAVTQLHRLARSPWIQRLDDEGSLAVAVDACISALGNDTETLTPTEFDTIESVALELEDIPTKGMPQYAQQLIGRMRQLAAEEGTDPPSKAAAEALWNESPDFLMFSDSDRLLRSTYPLSQVAHDPPAALRNLASLAGLDLPRLLAASRSDDHGLVETLTDTASNRLHTVMKKAWQQSDVDVRFRLNDDTLRVMIQTDGTGFWEIADRSDGLRAFVALVAFVSNRDKDAILLIDEAEIHLHYDAQADLVQMLERQPLVRQVIYTTHSAGCLPEDLTSVRTVVPQPNSEASILRNWFWEGQEAGFAPLLTGMGAATLAFVPTRFAVLVEGPTDLILLPTLIREASGQPSLGFQVAPGLAGAAPSEISGLDMQGPRIVYLLDNDDGGDGIARKLGQAGIGQDRIVRISRIRDSVIEDLVDPEAYLTAINAELVQSGHDPMPSSELDQLNRPRSVETWCKNSGFAAPVKRAVAQRLLEQAREGAPLLTAEGSDELQYLLSQIMSSFDSAPNALSTENAGFSR